MVAHIFTIRHFQIFILLNEPKIEFEYQKATKKHTHNSRKS